MMIFNVKQLHSAYDFQVTGVSYVGKPRDNTVMYVTKKAENLLSNLSNVSCCLIFAEQTVEIPDHLAVHNCFIHASVPQLAYTDFLAQICQQEKEVNDKRKYQLTPEGYWIGENVTIGSGAKIEPGCLIGHDVKIGANAQIFYGASIKNAIIGDNLIACEHCVIGAYAFTMTEDDHHDKIRIPTLGKVQIGNDVEIGVLNNISAGSAGDTIISDHVKLDALVHIAHDVQLHKNVELPAGVIIGGFAELQKSVFVGLNATIKNRITIGADSIVGMGAAVTKSVDAQTTVAGNPAKKLERRT